MCDCGNRFASECCGLVLEHGVADGVNARSGTCETLGAGDANCECQSEARCMFESGHEGADTAASRWSWPPGIDVG